MSGDSLRRLHMRPSKLVILVLVADLASVILTFVAPVLSTGICVFAVASIADRFAISSRILLALAPVLYVSWLIVFLAISALEMRLLGLVYSKPEHAFDPMESGRYAMSMGVVNYIYRREIFVHALPMFGILTHPPFVFLGLKTLAMHAYAPSVHMGKNIGIFTWLQDPDLTYIGDNVIIGNATEVVCHAFNRRPGGSSVYQAARTTIRSNVTIGGNCRIAMGVQIDEHAMVEIGSNLLPFSRIGRGEVWGGNPAVFLRMREGFGPVQAPAPARSDDLDRAALRAIVAKAIGRRPEDVGANLRADNCAAWDSLAKMAIAAGLYDRFGVRIAAGDVPGLDSVSSIERLLASSAGPKTPAVPSARREAPEEDLYDDPELLPLLDPQAVTQALARRFEGTETGPARRIVVSATFTSQPLAAPLELWCRAFGVPVAVHFQDFNQVEQALLSPDSPFHGNESGLNVVLVRPEDLIAERDPDGMVRARQLLAAIEGFRSGGGFLVVSSLPPVVSPFFHGDPAATERLRLWWGEELRQRDGVQILDLSGIVEEVGRENARDTASEVVARSPYSPVLFQRLALAITRLVRGRFVPSKKVLAIDCDNLLWGGVIGEDGIDGIELDDEHPGRSFRLLQRSILELKKRGVLVVLVSKNEAADVWNAFDAHPGMALRRQDIAAARINWRAKSANLRELAEELNLGLDSFVFLDDSAVERQEVKVNAPEVTVVPLPEDPTRFAEMLARLWCFDATGLTAEDASRTELVSDEGKRRKLLKQAGGLDAFLASLELAVEVRPPSEREMPRVAQLTQKTNQFNLSLKRRSLPEVREARSSSTILILSARDRLGDYGLVGLAIFECLGERLLVDTFLMSCRALGRGIEDAFLSALFEAARRAGCATVVAPFREGPRNQQTKAFLLKAGFADSNGTLSMPVAKGASAPKHLRLSLTIDDRLLEVY